MPALPLKLFDYSLPADQIAQEPVRPRDASRLLCLGRAGKPLSHRRFFELPEILAPGDLLVVNRTRVIPARLRVTRATGGAAELLLFRPLDGSVDDARRWQALGRPARALRPGVLLTLGDGRALEVLSRDGDTLTVRLPGPASQVLASAGEVPLPPYIEREAPRASDADDYQSVFAREAGAVAAPTASLHFTERVLEGLRARGVERAEVVLHVGPGTFLPVRSDFHDDVRAHRMHSERYSVPAQTQRAIDGARRVVAVGTTVVRALETWRATGRSEGDSDLFIYPGFSFRAVDAMITNFHLPKSTLLMLVAAFCGRERLLDAYERAVAEGYRFYSYGDAMLIA